MSDVKINYGIRVRGTDNLLWGPDHIRSFKPWPETARRYPTIEAAVARMKEIVSIHQRMNAAAPYLDASPTNLEVVEIKTVVTATDYRSQ